MEKYYRDLNVGGSFLTCRRAFHEGRGLRFNRYVDWLMMLIRVNEKTDYTDLVLGQILRRFPNADVAHAQNLANLWSDVVSRIIDRMCELTRSTGRVVRHIDSRREEIQELAKLTHFMIESILNHRLTGRELGDIDPVKEKSFLLSEGGRQLADGTGKMFADHIWSKVYDDLAVKYPLIVKPSKSGDGNYRVKGSGRGQKQYTKENHFIPAFANAPWADKNGKVRELRASVGGKVRDRLRGYARWGFKTHLYPQWLERYFGAVETEAAPAYKKLLASIPLDDREQQVFGTFLLLQILRTPHFIANSGLQLRQLIRARGWKYGTDEASLRRPYEALCAEDRVHSVLHARISRRRWSILRSPKGRTFLRTDAGVVVPPQGKEKQWSCVFPLSPTACLKIGPEKAAGNDSPIPHPEKLTEALCDSWNRQLASFAVESVVVHPDDDLERWKRLLPNNIAERTAGDVARYKAWGKVVGVSR